MIIYCCKCMGRVDALHVKGKVLFNKSKPIYSKIKDNSYWQCPDCGCYVGCHGKHYNEEMRMEPLGTIPFKELAGIRQRIHKSLDRLWRIGDEKSYSYRRMAIYKRLSTEFNVKYHTANINTMDRGREVLEFVRGISNDDAEDLYRKMNKKRVKRDRKPTILKVKRNRRSSDSKNAQLHRDERKNNRFKSSNYSDYNHRCK